MAINDIRRSYQSGVSNAPDTTGVFSGVVTRIESVSEVYIRVPRLTGTFENLARNTVTGLTVGDTVFIGLVEGRRDDFVILGKLL